MGEVHIFCSRDQELGYDCRGCKKNLIWNHTQDRNQTWEMTVMKRAITTDKSRMWEEDKCWWA